MLPKYCINSWYAGGYKALAKEAGRQKACRSSRRRGRIRGTARSRNAVYCIATSSGRLSILSFVNVSVTIIVVYSNRFYVQKYIDLLFVNLKQVNTNTKVCVQIDLSLSFSPFTYIYRKIL